MSKISTYLSVSFIVISFILGIGVGYYITPEYSLSMYEKNEMDLGRPDKWVDQRYLNEMIRHHRGAILLAEQAEKSQRTEIKNLAVDIQNGEPKLIEELYSWKKEWYQDNRKVNDPVVSNLGNYDETFDLRFLNALIAHHENGIKMTDEISKKSSRSEVLNNANAVENFLKGSITTLLEWRTNWYQ